MQPRQERRIFGPLPALPFFYPLSAPRMSAEFASAYVDINAPLVERCRLHDRQAQAELYRRYSKAMFNAALRITGDYAEAEDVLQESFLSAFRELHGYKGDSSFGAWLKRIVVNKSINCLRQRRLALVPLAEQHDAHAEAAPSAADPDDEAEQHYRADVLRRCIQDAAAAA